jgi:hypothetical protein
MKRFIMGLGLAAALAIPGASHASGVLYTFPHTTHFPEQLYIDCIAQNFNTTPQTVTIDFLDALGAVVQSTGPVSVAAGQAADRTQSPPAPPIVTACRFTVTGSVKKWRTGAFVFGTDLVLRAIVEGK